MTTALPCNHQHKKLVNALWCVDCGAYNELDGNNWQLPSGRVEREQGSAILCQHANEVPHKCSCDDNCYCKSNTCKPPSGKTLSLEKAVEALQALYDVQNGSPLIKYEAEWNEAMKLASDVLDEFNAQKGTE